MDSVPSKPPTAAMSEPQLPPPAPNNKMAGTKRPAAALLPAFEPLSSSPALPRPLKRQNIGSAHLKYPTPIPTSSTGILSSSPLRVRSNLMRSEGSERTPLSAVPSVELSENGEALIMGRSSNSSHFQLSANRLISRVHVKARYIASASPLEPNKIEIVCNGWNGVTLHCQGRTWELFKGDSFTSETEGTEIMVDVQNARVMLQWPRRPDASDVANLSDSTWDDSPPRSQTRPRGLLASSSPLRRPARIQSPESPTIAHLSSSQRLQALLPGGSNDGDSGIEIYEDEPEDENLLPETVDAGVSIRTEVTASFTSTLSELDENDPDEENDPIIHSFGPFGADITARLASIATKSPKGLIKQRRPVPVSLDTLREVSIPSDPPSPSPPTAQLRATTTLPVAQAEAEVEAEEVEKPATEEEKNVLPTTEVVIDPAVTNHVINQLAFSRLSSTPLSTIMQHLPTDLKTDLPREALRQSIEATQCIGIIKRQGKDAAGKALESEYYYIPDADDDEQRRAAVVDGMRKPSLRNCRKQHKQYYWKRPKTP